jgi:uncharacterized protein (DUF1800 family)
VFTGFSWACPAAPHKNCFLYGSNGDVKDPDRGFKPMVRLSGSYHSTDEKRFLGTTIPAQTMADPMASLKAALDTLFLHPNVGPFIGTPADPALGHQQPQPGLRGCSGALRSTTTAAACVATCKAVVQGHADACRSAVSESDQCPHAGGKVREPVLRLSALLRAFNYASDSGLVPPGQHRQPRHGAGPVAAASPSVFNFYRPGYVPPGTLAASHGLAVPEMQIVCTRPVRPAT